MMKRTLIVAVAMGLVASTGMAATLLQIAPLGTATSSDARAITPDGLYVVGHDGGTTADRAFYWTAAGGTQGPMLAGSYLSQATGIAYRTNPISGAQELMVGGKQSSGQVGLFRSTDAGATWTRPFGTSGAAPTNGAGNIVGGGSPTSDQTWISWGEGTSALSITSASGDPVVTATSTKSVTQKSQIWGVSNTGRAAANRRDTSSIYQNMWLGYVTGGGTATQNFFAGLDGTLHGVAFSMSGDGTKVFGHSPITTDTVNNYGYKRDIAGATTTALPELVGTGGSTSRAIPYGASADGNYAVGMQYLGMEKAVLWYNLNDPNPANWGALDLTQYAIDHGILGEFTGNLRRAYSIADIGGGQVTIVGMGVAYATGTTVALVRGFVMTIPEPATLTFLALGGLAMLRRRR